MNSLPDLHDEFTIVHLDEATVDGVPVQDLPNVNAAEPHRETHAETQLDLSVVTLPGLFVEQQNANDQTMTENEEPAAEYQEKNTEETADSAPAGDTLMSSFLCNSLNSAVYDPWEPLTNS